MRNYSIKDLRWSNRGHELDHFAEMITDKNNQFYIYGNEHEIEEFYQRVGKYLAGNIGGCVCMQGKVNKELYVCNEADIPDMKNTRIICTYKNREKYERLRENWDKKGYRENEKFFQGEVFEMVYEVYAKDEIKLDRIEVFLTSCCTLNCEKCISFIPYFKKPVIIPLQQLKDDADLLFSKVDYVYKMKLLGGEVLLYPYLTEYIDYLYTFYGDRIGTIRIGTNGTVFPGQAVLEMCRKDHVTVDISDYMEAVPNMCMLDEVKKICEDNGISVDVKRTGEQWLDMGFPNNLPEEKTEEELRKHFHKCAMFCRQYNAGKYYFCCSNFAAVCAGMFQEDGNDYFDLREEFTKKELLEFELGYSKKGHTTFCSVCRGCSEEANSCHVEVAKQINRENRGV